MQFVQRSSLAHERLHLWGGGSLPCHTIRLCSPAVIRQRQDPARQLSGPIVSVPDRVGPGRCWSGVGHTAGCRRSAVAGGQVRQYGVGPGSRTVQSLSEQLARTGACSTISRSAGCTVQSASGLSYTAAPCRRSDMSHVPRHVAEAGSCHFAGETMVGNSAAD